MTWSIFITPTAQRMLQNIPDERVRGKLHAAIDHLKQDPEKQGKALLGELAGFRCIRAAGQRYRVLYSVQKERVIIVIVAVGLRKEGAKKDVYALAKKLLRLRLLR
ncbi:MAG: type II toxin-antitoxin system RelE family toxin [Syntrophales bacterium]